MVLKNTIVAEKGNIACLDTADGSLTVGAVSTTLIPIGWFESTLTGDGTATIGVQLFAEIDCVAMINSSTGPVAAANIGSNCYLHSAFEVSMTATGKSVLGRVWGLVGTGAGAVVYVQPAIAGAA
jgi:hypothetical protein